MQPAANIQKEFALRRLCRWLGGRAVLLGPVLGPLVALALAPSAALGGIDGAEAASPRAVVAKEHVLAARSPSRAAATAPLIGGSGHFGGLTSKNWPVIVRLSRRGELIRQAVAGVELSCTSGDVFAVSDRWANLPIRNRRFGHTFTDTSSEAGMTYLLTDTVKGRLNRRRTRITGTWRNQFVVRNAAGGTVDVCDSGLLRYTAMR